MSRPSPGVLLVRIGSTSASKNSGASRSTSAASDSPGLVGNLRTVAPRRRQRVEQLVARQTQDELSRREVVVRAGVDPEQLRVAADLREHARLDVRAVRQDRLEHRAHLEVVRVALVVIDVAPGDRGEIEMPDEDLARGASSVAKPSAYSCTTAASSTLSRRYRRVSFMITERKPFEMLRGVRPSSRAAAARAS